MSKPPPVIAIVDDEPEVRDALSELLLSASLAARSFASAESFLIAYTPGVFAVVVTDLRMAGMTGLDLLDYLRRTEADLAVILVTSVADPETRRRALEAGAWAIVTKPFRAGELLDHILRALDARRSGPDA